MCLLRSRASKLSRTTTGLLRRWMRISNRKIVRKLMMLINKVILILIPMCKTIRNKMRAILMYHQTIRNRMTMCRIVRHLLISNRRMDRRMIMSRITNRMMKVRNNRIK